MKVLRFPHFFLALVAVLSSAPLTHSSAEASISDNDRQQEQQTKQGGPGDRIRRLKEENEVLRGQVRDMEGLFRNEHRALAANKKLDRCKSKLRDTKKDYQYVLKNYIAPTALEASLLYVQTAISVTAKKHGNKEGRYEVITNSISPETVVFSDRPLRVADAEPTKDFFDAFDARFTEETGGKPNAAITCTAVKDNGEEVFAGPIVATIVTATYSKNGDGTYTCKYGISQSPEQAEYLGIEDVPVNVFRDCSFFIDSVGFTQDVFTEIDDKFFELVPGEEGLRQPTEEFCELMEGEGLTSGDGRRETFSIVVDDGNNAKTQCSLRFGYAWSYCEFDVPTIRPGDRLMCRLCKPKKGADSNLHIGLTGTNCKGHLKVTTIGRPDGTKVVRFRGAGYNAKCGDKKNCKEYSGYNKDCRSCLLVEPGDAYWWEATTEQNNRYAGFFCTGQSAGCQDYTPAEYDFSDLGLP